MKKYVNSLGLNDVVTFLSSVQSDRLPEIYNIADVLVLPSETEGTPMCILEALACGTPVIASAVGGIPKLIHEGINGLLLDNPSAACVAEAVLRICRSEYRRVGVARTVSAFRSETIAKRIEGICENVIVRASGNTSPIRVFNHGGV